MKSVEQDWAVDFESGGTHRLAVLKGKYRAYLKKELQGLVSYILLLKCVCSRCKRLG